MANRCLLHRSKLEDLKTWLSDRALKPVGQWEVLRWKGPQGQPMRIIYDNDHSCEHLSCNDASVHDVMNFIRYYKQVEDKAFTEI